MKRLTCEVLVRARTLFSRQPVERESCDEPTTHLTMGARKPMAEGLATNEAEEVEGVRFGSVAGAAVPTRDAWGTSLFGAFTADVRHALRQMRRRFGLSSVLIVVLGIGIGVSVALCSVANSLLVRPLPYRDEHRIHVFWLDYSWSAEEYAFLSARLRVFARLAAYSTTTVTYAPNARPNEAAGVVSVAVSSPSLFETLGVRPMLGRNFDANDNHPTSAPVVVISAGLWRRDLGSDPNVIGRQIRLDDQSVTVIGVMPDGFYFPTPEQRAWRPLRLDASSGEWKSGYLTLVGRSQPGATAGALQGEVRRLAAALSSAGFTYPAAWDHTKNAEVIPVHRYLLGDVRAPLLLILSAVGLLFAIACANAAALILARTMDRSVEMAVRASLGAGAWRLARQVITESIVLALCAAGVGSILAGAGFNVLVARLPLPGGFGSAVAIGRLTFVIALGLGLVIATVVSIVPVRALLRGRLGAAVNRERSDEGLRRGTRRLHSVIITVQVAFGVMLVVGATMLIRSLERLREVDTGFDARGVTTYSLFSGSAVLPETRGQVFQDLLARVEALPSVSSAGLTNRLPVRDGGYQTTAAIEGRPDLDGASAPTVLYRTATPGFFATMGMRLIAGRGIDSTDAAAALPVVVISESFAKAMWPGQSAIGKHVSLNWGKQTAPRMVIGVLREAHLTSLTTPSRFASWIPLAQYIPSPSAPVLVVRSAADPATIMPAVRNLVAAVDSRVAIPRVQTMDEAVATTLTAPLRLRFFFGAFAAVALILGAVGVFGVVSYAIARRSQEFAVRMALGAAPHTLSRHVLTFALTPVAIGVGTGSIVAAASTRLLGGYVYGIALTDTMSFGISAATLLCAGAVGALVPVIRVSRTNPANALRGGAL